MLSAFEKVYGPSYEEEKEQTVKELKALLLTFPEARNIPRTYVIKAIKFIEQE
jgi:hypothetical protein